MNIIVATHNNLAESFVKTAKMIIGEVNTHKVYTAGIYEETGIECLEKEICEIKNKLDDNSVLVLTDLFGASPFNVCLRILKDFNVRIVTGINLPMLIEVLMSGKDSSLEDLVEISANNGVNGVKVFPPEKCVNF